MDKKLIAITPGTLVTVLVVAVSAFALWILRDLLLLVLAAVVIASAIEPGVQFFIRHRLPRILSVLLMYVAVFGSVATIAYFFLPPIIDDLQGLVASAPQYVQALAPEQGLGTEQALLATSAGGEAQSFVNTLLQFRSAFADTSGGLLRLFATFFGGIFSFFLVVMLSFYFALQETTVTDFLRIVTPARHEEYVLDLWRRAHKKIGLWMQGQVVLSLIVGVLVYLGLLIAGVPYALLIAVITSMCDLIPVFGSIVAGVLGVAVALAHGGIPLALIAAGLYLIINQFESNLIYPLVVKKVVGLSPVLVILAIIAGGTLAGFLGVLLSIPVAAALQEFVTDMDKKKRHAHSRS